MGNCMNACSLLQRSSKDHHDNKMETTRSTLLLPPQKQSRREVVEYLEGERRRSRTTKVIVNENIKGSDDGGDHKEGVMRVKIVLTKDELQWLMTQLKSDGDKRLENMLEEIEKGRKNNIVNVCDGGKGNNGWKPSLESIMETPE